MIKKLILKMLGAIDKSEFEEFKSSCSEFMLDYLKAENAKLALNMVEKEYSPEISVFVTINYSFISGCKFKNIRVAPWVSGLTITGCHIVGEKGE
jgi:hypothetical protein